MYEYIHLKMMISYQFWFWKALFLGHFMVGLWVEIIGGWMYTIVTWDSIHENAYYIEIFGYEILIQLLWENWKIGCKFMFHPTLKVKLHHTSIVAEN